MDISENPNPNAKIAFVIFNRFQYYIFKNVYKYIDDKAEFIIDTGRKPGVNMPRSLIENIAKFLESKGAKFRILYNDNYLSAEYLDGFFAHYTVLVSLWQSGSINLNCNKNKRKVHMNYGAGKELSIFGTYHRRWDLYLCFSNYIFNIIKLYTKAVVVGYPRFDDWFNNELNADEISNLRKKIDPRKKTLLYLPTHSDLGSMRELTGPLKQISDKYNILVKLHYHTPTEEPELADEIKHKGILIFEDDADLLVMLKVSDVVLSDNSSAIFDAILADKPVIASDFLTDKFLDTDHQSLKFYVFGSPNTALTYSGSIEQKIKKQKLIITFQKPEELEDALDLALIDTPYYKEARKKLAAELFAFNDGRCGRRAANQLEQLLVVRNLPSKPVLYHVMEAEFKRGQKLAQRSKLGNIPDTEKSLRFTRIKHMPFHKKIFAVIEEFFLNK